jgi:hypothetical protein
VVAWQALTFHRAEGGCSGVRKGPASCGHARRARLRHAGGVGAGVGSCGGAGPERGLRGTDVIAPPDVAGIIGYLREHGVTLTWEQNAATLRAATIQAISTQAG